MDGAGQVPVQCPDQFLHDWSKHINTPVVYGVIMAVRVEAGVWLATWRSVCGVVLLMGIAWDDSTNSDTQQQSSRQDHLNNTKVKGQ